MARDLEINIVVNDGDAKSKLEGVDAAHDKAAASAHALAKAESDLEVRMRAAAAAAGMSVAELQKLKDQMASGTAETKKTLDAVAQGMTAAGKSSAESARLIAGMSEAGRQAAAGLQKIPPAAKEATDGLDRLESMAGRIVTRMALLYALRGSFQFVESLFTDAQKLETVAAELGLTTDRVQQLQYIATTTYLPMSLFSSAIGELTKKVITENGGAAAALKSLGLSLADLKTREAGERFDIVTKALADVKDNATRLGLELELLGNDKLDNAVQKMAALEKEANALNSALSKEQVDALADVAKGWDLALAASKNYFAGVAANITLASQGKSGAPQTTTGNVGGMLAAIFPLLPASLQATLAGTYTADVSNAALDRQTRTRHVDTPGWVAQASQAPLGLPGSFGQELSKAELAEIAAIDKTLTDEVNNRIQLEKEEAALQHDMWSKSLQTARLISKEFEKQIASLQKEMDLAIQAEFEARKANAAAQGFDVAGNRLGTPGAIGSPEDVYRNTMMGIARQKERMPGLSTSEQEAQAFRVLRGASRGSTDAYGNAIQAGTDLYGNPLTPPGFAKGGIVTLGEHGPERVALPYGSAVYPNEDDGLTPMQGGTRGAPGSWQAQSYAELKGKWFSGRDVGGAMASSSDRSVSVGDVHIHGNVTSELDLRRAADDVARRIKDRLDQQTKFQPRT